MLDYSQDFELPAASVSIAGHCKSKAPVPLGLIGPNSIIQLQNALVELHGEEKARAIFARADLAYLYDRLPTSMIDEAIPKQLFDSLYDSLPYEVARRVALRAGELTADYIIANRIPRPVSYCLKLLPPKLSGVMLLKAIQRNAWTFVGSGRFRYETSPICLVSIAGNPLGMPECAWHVAVFQHLFSRLVCKESKVKHLNSNTSVAGKDSFIICYGKKFFIHDCERVRKHKLRYLCSKCVS